MILKKQKQKKIEKHFRNSEEQKISELSVTSSDFFLPKLSTAYYSLLSFL